MDAIDRRRERRRSRHRTALLVGGGGCAALLLVTCGLLGLWLGATPRVLGPTAGREGEAWTHTELVAHLKDRGLAVEVVDRNPILIGGPAVTVGDGRGRVTIQKRGTARDAADQAGAAESGFAWGRFLFVGDEELLGRMSRVLR